MACRGSHDWRVVCCGLFLLMLFRLRHADAACADVPVQFKSVNESAAVGSVIQTVDASYTGSFSATPSQYGCYFSVSGGALILAKVLDLENLTSCSDGSRTPVASVPNAMSIALVCTSSSVETLVVNLVDINEFAPAFNPNSFSVNVSEAASVSSFVIQLNSYVKDADKSNQDTFNFLLLAGASAKFNMPDSATSGIIRVSGELDFDNGQRLYSLNVSAAELASNPGSLPGPLTGFATVEVRVTDSDDQNQVFVDSGYSLSFMENDSSLLGQQLATQPSALEARDLDLGINQTVNYAIESGNVLNNATFLEINATTGALRLTSVLDRETLVENPMWLRVKAYQTDKPDLRTAVTFVSVIVSDKNDNNPAMSAASYSASIVENSPNGTFVTQVAATDADAGSSATLIYKLTDASGAFLIEPSTGIVRVANAALLDRETAAQLSLTVWAEESQSAERFTSPPSPLTVNLTDANDNAPAFAQATYAFSISTAAGVGTAVGQVSATDQDTGSNAAIAYSLAFASPAGALAYFSLDSGNGSLTVSGLLTDLSAYAAIVFMAVAEDQAIPTALRQRSAVAVTVTLTVETSTSTASTTPATTTTTTMTTTTTTTTTPTTTTNSPTTTTSSSTLSTATTLASTSAAVWNASTSVVSSRQINETHVILETETTIFDVSGRSIRFNQSTLTLLPTTATPSTTAAPSNSTTPSSVTSSSTASPTTTSMTPSGGSSTANSTLQTVLIALCALMALLLAAALVAILCFWKRRPGSGGTVAPGHVGGGGGDTVGADGGSGDAKDGGATTQRSTKGRLASNRHSSRINYSEFYFDDRDVSGNPIMVLHQSGPVDPTDQKPPSYSQLPRVAK